jgi:hypothetical protein
LAGARVENEAGQGRNQRMTCTLHLIPKGL